MKGASQCDWWPVQHAPDVSSAVFGAEEQTQLASEVFTVRHRSPDLEIRLPPFRPNTRRVGEVYAALFQADPSGARRFRDAAFRRLWVDGEDLSDDAVVGSILYELELEWPEIGSIPRSLQRSWQLAWEGAGFERRVPCIGSGDGRVLLGLAGTEELARYFEGSDARHTSGDSSEYVPRPVTLVVGLPSALWPLVAEFNARCDVVVALDGKAAATLLDEIPTDVIVVDGVGGLDPVDLCSQLSRGGASADVPILVVGGAEGPGGLDVLHAGASDYFESEVDPALFGAKFRVHLEAKRKLDRLRRRVRLDGLTGIPGRRELDRLAELEWRRGLRNHDPLTVLLIDIDFFKPFNDHYGHLQGDAALVAVARALVRTAQRASDCVARYGGEEFAAVLPDVDGEAARLLAERCRDSVAALKIPHAASSVAGVVTVSVGVCTVVPRGDLNLHTMIATADAALYAAKAAGRNCVEVRPYGAAR